MPMSASSRTTSRFPHEARGERADGDPGNDVAHDRGQTDPDGEDGPDHGGDQGGGEVDEEGR